MKTFAAQHQVFESTLSITRTKMDGNSYGERMLEVQAYVLCHDTRRKWKKPTLSMTSVVPGDESF